jgi:hypothetical protein
VTLLAPPGPLYTLIQLAEETAAYVLDGADPLGLRTRFDWEPTPDVVSGLCAARRASVPQAGAPARRHLGRIVVASAALVRGFDPEIILESDGFLGPFPPPDTWVALCGDAANLELIAWVPASLEDAVTRASGHGGVARVLRWLEDTDLPARRILGRRRRA